MTRYTHPDLDIMYKSLHEKQRIAYETHARFVGDTRILNN